jgi:hypothetical protein
VVSGVGQLIDLTIDPGAIDPADPAESASTIADLVLAAVRDAWDGAVDLQQRQLGALGGGGFGGAPGGFDLSALGLPSYGGELAYDDDDDDDEDDVDEDEFDDEDQAPGAPGGEPGASREEHKD